MHLTRYGHSCLLVESGGARILLDPGGFSHGFEELTGLDAIVVTHQHPDHLDTSRLPLLLEANDGARLLAEPETAAQLSDVGIAADAIRPGESVSLGGTTITGDGGVHAEIHPDIPLIGNVGMIVSAEGEPTFFHPGDAYAATPAGVEVLALPLTAPWARLAMTVEFARQVAAPRLVPIHDAVVSDLGRPIFVNQLKNLAPDSEIVDLRAGDRVAF